jgi:uncharacterized membrane protein
MEWVQNFHWADWGAYLIRWVHLIAGISWIGSSFYFMWLDASLEKPKTSKPDVEGELWMVHSGGFYEVERKRIGPGSMPEKLHWFKFEALLTWISGMALLVVAYYFNAAAFMVDPAVAQVHPHTAVTLSVLILASSWFLYDGLWQSPIGKKSPHVATTLSLVLAGSAAFGFCQYLSGRAAFIHVGAMFGTWMVANVWVRILPAQQRMIDATQEGRTPDFAHSGYAKRRSVHNTYMTFPVLFMMLSNHYPHTYSGRWNWVALILMIVLGAAIRHVMVAKSGSGKWAIAPAAVASAILLVLTATFPEKAVHSESAHAALAGPPVPFQQVHDIINSRCVSCHSAQPVIGTFGPMPGGVNFDTPERIRSLAERIKIRAVTTRTMPLANQTQMTDEERLLLGRWIDQGAKIEKL